MRENVKNNILKNKVDKYKNKNPPYHVKNHYIKI